MPQNEMHTGRTVYRRTTVVVTTDPRTGRRKRQTAVRPEATWVEVPGATQAVIPREL